MQSKVLKLDSKDNVLIALTDLRRGEQIFFDVHNYTLESDVPAKHKFATEDLAAGASVTMARWAREIIGSWCRWCSAKTATSGC